MEEVVEFTADFVKQFEAFELPPIKVSKEEALSALKKK